MICLKDRVALHRGARLEAAVARRRRRGTPSRPSVRSPYQPRVVRARTARGTTRTRSSVAPLIDAVASRRSRACPQPVARSPRSSGPPDALEVGQPCRRGRPERSRIRAAMAGGVGDDDPGAHRHVAARQAGHVAPAARGKLRGRRPVRRASARSAPATASTSAAATTSGRWLDPGDGLVVRGGGHAERSRAARPAQGLRPRSTAAVVGGRARRPTVDRRTGPRCDGAVAGRLATRPSDGRRRTAARAPSARATMAALVLATSVIDGVRREGRPPRTGELVELGQADRRAAPARTTRSAPAMAASATDVATRR